MAFNLKNYYREKLQPTLSRLLPDYTPSQRQGQQQIKNLVKTVAKPTLDSISDFGLMYSQSNPLVQGKTKDWLNRSSEQRGLTKPGTQGLGFTTKGFQKIGDFGARSAGLLAGPAALVTTALLAGGINTGLGDKTKKASERFAEGVSQAPLYAGFGKISQSVTNPYLSKLAPKLSGSTLGNFLSGRAGGAVANVGEGIGFDVGTGFQTTPTSVAMDALAGFARPGFDVPNTNKASFRLDKNTYDELVQADEILLSPEKYVDSIGYYKSPQARDQAIEKAQSFATETIDRIAAKYLPNKELDKYAGNYSKMVKAIVDLHGKNKLTNVSNFVSDSTTSKQSHTEPKPRTTEQAVQISQSTKGSGQEKSFEDIIRRESTDVKNKVGMLDYFRTPDRVLEKIGLGEEAKLIRKKYDDYLDELPQHIDKITQWSKEVPKESNQRIFRYLDGQDIQLNKQELKVAGEIQDYLKQWADRLGLPEDKRIANYITHIFEKDFIQKEFDDDLAKLIRNRVAGSVYDPFLEKRLGQLGYVEDTWRALDAYVKRATRKANMDVALEKVKKAAEGLEQSQYNYVKGRIDRVNLRPTDWDNLLDNTVKQLVGYKFGARPTTALSRKARQWVYRGTLGLNPGVALKNLTQGANTYAKLGERWTLKGYIDTLIKGGKELEDVGVLRNDFIQDRTLSSGKQLIQKLDSGLFYFFEMAERINRGAAYYGAKAKALNRGMNEEESIEYAKKIVRDTQFTFGSVDTPAVLSSDIAKTLGQFQSYSLKQGEFLAEMVKNKEFLGLIRYGLASSAMVMTIGQLAGMDFKDIIPSFRIGLPPTLQLPVEVGKAIAGTPDEYGNIPDTEQKIKNVGSALVPFIPAGSQIKKTVSGLSTVGKGYSESAAGRVRTPVDQSTSNYLRGGLFGQHNLPEMQEYYDEERTVLGEKQSELIKSASPSERKQLYKDILEQRVVNAKEDEIKEQVRGDGKVRKSPSKVYYYDSESDEVRSIPLQRDLKMPKLSGNETVDKELLKDYKSTLTKKQTDVIELYKRGYMSAQEAEWWYQTIELFKDELSKKTSKSGGSKKAKYVPLKIPKAKSRSTKSIATPKLLGQETIKISTPKFG